MTQDGHGDQEGIGAQPQRDHRGRWLPGTSGNSAGGPLGNKSKVRRALDKAVEEAAEAILGSVEAGSGGGKPPASGLELLQSVYRDLSKPLDIRIEAATRAARFESPALSASLTATVDAKQAEGARLTEQQRRRRIAELLAQSNLAALPAPNGGDGALIEGRLAGADDPAGAIT